MPAQQRSLAKELRTTWRRGTQQKALVQALHRRGLRTKIVEPASFADMRHFAKKKYPVIVNWYAALIHPAKGHYSVVVHIDAKHIWLADPDLGKVRKLTLKSFKQLWFDFDGDLEYDRPPLKTHFNWMLVVYPPVAFAKTGRVA